MIIGINGYIGSGKDTVGKIIQSLFAKEYGVYKNQIDFINGGDWVREKQSGWEIKKFAGKLKQIASLITGIPVEKFEDQEFKQTFLGPEWSSLIERGEDEAADYHMMTVREFLQKLGTEAVREGLHTNAWVNALFADYKSIGGTMDVNRSRIEYPNWIITDTRFPNEAQAIKDRGGIVVRVNRLKSINLNKDDIKLHPSETSLDDWDFDHIINNDGTIDELIPKVKEMLEKFNLL